MAEGEGAILVGAKSAMFDYDGRRMWIRPGWPTVREGHPLLKGREHLFKPFTVDFDLPSKDSSASRPGTAKAKDAGSGT